MKKIIIIAMLSIVLAACATTNVGTDFDMTKVSLIQKGQTTQTDVIAMFGKPTTVSNTSNGMSILGYSHVKSHGNALGQGSSTVKILTITLENGIVKDYSQTENSAKINSLGF